MADGNLWITSAEAARIMTETHGRPISQAQVRQLGRRPGGANSIRTKPLHARTNLYHRHDVEKARITERTVSRSPRKPGRPRKEEPAKEEEHQAYELAIS